jgi:hypothetical protein
MQAPLVVTSLSLSAAIQYSSKLLTDPKQDLRPNLTLPCSIVERESSADSDFR